MTDPRTEALVTRIGADPIWREKLAAAENEADFVAIAVAASAAHGDPRTAEEVRDYIADRRAADGDRELSDAELDIVAGGVAGPFTPP